MDAQLERSLIEIALEAAVQNFGQPVRMDSEAVYLKNEETGKIKRLTFSTMVDGINSAITDIRKEV